MSDHALAGKKPLDEEEVYKYLLDRINDLEKRNTELREQVRQLESDKRYGDTQKIRYEREIRKLKSEIEQLRSPPLIIAMITDVIDKNRVVVRSSAGPRFLVRTSQFIDQDLLKPGVRCTLNQQSLAIVDVLKRPELFSTIGIKPPKGVLLYGPPGTGKTLLARAVAHETSAHFLRVIASELVQKYIGEGARLVRELFDMAKDKSPAIIFIDEIDAIGATRMDADTSGDREVQRTLMQLLAEMDGFDERGDVEIVGATNRIDILDRALLRPGRFDRIIEIPLPVCSGRLAIFRIHCRGMNISEDVDLEEIARLTDGRNGADIRAICMEAGMYAIRAERSRVNREDFLKAIEKVTVDYHKHQFTPSFGTMYA
jgi:proteasome regulatory subunit